MALSKNKIIYDLLASIAGESRIPQDVGIDTALISFKIDNTRSFLIRQDQGKGRSLSDNIIQTLPCVPVIEISTSECPCSVPSNCTIMRTKDKLPHFIELYQKDLITKVSGSDVTSKGWSIVSFARASYAGTNSWTRINTKVFVHNHYLYIINPPLGLQMISIDGVLENPEDAKVFNTCFGTPCYSDDDDYPISAHMLLTMKELVIKDLGLLLQSGIDSIANEKYEKGVQTDNTKNQ